MTLAELSKIKGRAPDMIHGEFFDTVDLSGWNLKELVFCDCYFTKAIFDNANFSQSVFQRCTFVECSFNNTKFSDSVFISGQFIDCRGLDGEHEGLREVSFINVAHRGCGDGAFESMPINCPSSGSFIGWKACYLREYVGSGVLHARSITSVFSTIKPVIVKLRIPATAERVSGINSSRKCRASEAKVLGFYTIEGDPIKMDNPRWVVTSGYDLYFPYFVGETVKPTNDFDSSRETCAAGIHFFLDFKAAVDYIHC